MNVLRWFGHAEGMDNEQLLMNWIMKAGVDGRRVRGWSRAGWRDGVKRALNKRWIDVREAGKRARNRNEWRAIVNRN